MATRKKTESAASEPGSDRREQLLAIAAHLIATRGYSATTVRDIADDAGILSGSLYHHFSSKEAILEEILRSFQGGLRQRSEEIAAAGGGPRHVFDELVRTAFVTIEKQPDAVGIYQNEAAFLANLPGFEFVAEEGARIEGIWQEVIQEGQREGVFRADLDSAMTYRFIRDAVWSTVRWFRPGGRPAAGGGGRPLRQQVHNGRQQD
ncbi:TetR/AcrR family transcriptional regulator [Arthrobacter sp. zg-Y1219]|uniref:TetR/AcrR family transcriptional regulator n=1 Tax=Arthrobacter sp. zg-Y1219 TaxID=3049067 RepID=UPI0024C24FDE|nr:TetR/AcrR family transcriptional regulator [Arthrobacter sp. zg-Y1219]MDK1358718.1 TetR/AcrR family transcriptional regulator [Arthrobacter sp. zg-Y1219]